MTQSMEPKGLPARWPPFSGSQTGPQREPARWPTTLSLREGAGGKGAMSHQAWHGIPHHQPQP